MTLLVPDAPTLFLNARLIDGFGGTPVDGAAVLVEGNKITRVGRTSDFGESPNGNNRTVDLAGQDADARPDRGPFPHLVLGRP